MKEDILNLLVKKKKYRDCEYSQAKLAADLGISTFVLSRQMKQLFGMTYTDLVHKHRIKDAMRYLDGRKRTHYTMDEISVLVGFGNRQSFYTAFKKETGLTPEMYRNK
ncbi:MAG: AraC family transcriptional regulator [Bacteroidaceae bacterium]|nr:AraC family transcriptional regulator [Bacteroidaceae bacterium]